jgi:hypothetical protein
VPTYERFDPEDDEKVMSVGGRAYVGRAGLREATGPMWGERADNDAQELRKKAGPPEDVRREPVVASKHELNPHPAIAKERVKVA